MGTYQSDAERTRTALEELIEARRVNIYIHVERLGPEYDAGFVHFSLNLSVAIADSDTDPIQAGDLALLRPWEWMWQQVGVLGVDGSNKTVTIDAAAIEVLPDPTNAPQELIDALVRTQNEISDNGNRLAPFRAALLTPRAEEVFDENARSWKGFLSHASTFPAPLAQADNIKLTRFFRVKKQAITDAGAVELVAAPIFTSGPLKTSAPDIPDQEDERDVTVADNPLFRVPAANGQPSYYLWKYVSAVALPITASLNRCATKEVAEDPTGFISLKQLWVLAKTPTVLPEDWTTRFERKLGDACDMPRRLLDALRNNVDDLTWDIESGFHAAFVASLRDLANYGLSLGPDEVAGAKPGQAKTPKPRSRLADVLLDGIPEADRAIETLRLSEPLRYRTFDDWQQRLFIELWPLIDPHSKPPERAPAAVPQNPDATRAARRDYLRALEHVHAALAADANVLTILLAEWKRELENPKHDLGLPKTFFTTHQPTIAARARDLPLRVRFSFANAGAAWRLLARTLNKTDALDKQIEAALKEYVGSRFNAAPANEYAAYRPPVTSPPPDLTASLKEFTKDFVEKTLLPPAPDGDDPGSVREELTIQVADLEGHGVGDDDEDVLRHVAGVGVLMREEGTTAWRCLNLARLEVDGTAVAGDARPAPLRLGYRNGVRESHVSYRNHPMAARSPAAGLSINNTMQHPDKRRTLIGYANPYGLGGPTLVPLIYGRVYEAAVFAIGNASSLPRALATTTNGKTLPSAFKFPTTEQPPATQKIPYRRRVPIGPVRLEPKGGRSKGAETSQLEIPPIPGTVLPRTRSLFKLDPELQHQQHEEALVLLTPRDPKWIGRSEFSFSVRPPSVPIEVWDRWIATTASKDLRKRVWARVHEGADTPNGISKADRDDITIDDPAVSALEFTFTRSFPENAPLPETRTRTVKATGDCNGNLLCVQAPGIAVSITAGSATTLPSAGPNDPVNVTIGPGEIWRMDITPKISDPARFEPASSRARPVTMFIEVAEELERGVTDAIDLLQNSLKVTFDPEKQQLLASIDPSKPSPLWGRLHRVETLVQRWRWDGRPVATFEDAGTNTPSIRYGFPADAKPDALEPFDGVLFASRDSSDHLVSPAHVDFVAKSDTTSRLVYTAGLQALPGALYFRVAVRVFSRYEGLRSVPESVDSRTPAPGTTDRPEHWARHVVPCRFGRTVPRPSIRLILPLTASTPASIVSNERHLLQPGANDQDPVAALGRNPGLLVVLDESWYADTLGGIGETLDWDIARAALPAAGDKTLLEFGPDPILDLSPDPLTGRLVEKAPPIGAMGYTMDSGTLAPLFTRASFIVPPPAVEGIDDLSWYFMKVRFRRRLTISNGRSNPHSDWTDARWTQLLPPSNIFNVEGGTPSTIDVESLVLDAAAGFRLRAGGAVMPKPTEAAPGSQSWFTLWALVTQAIVDALGHREQESFVELAPASTIVAILARTPGAIVRLVEVQSRKETLLNTQADLLKALFPPDGEKEPEAQARAVRVSRPITGA